MNDKNLIQLMQKDLDERREFIEKMDSGRIEHAEAVIHRAIFTMPRDWGDEILEALIQQVCSFAIATKSDSSSYMDTGSTVIMDVSRALKDAIKVDEQERSSR